MDWQTQHTYSSCQLVAATNAALLLGTIPSKPTRASWEGLVDLTGCRAGSCLSVDLAHQAFGIQEVPIPNTLRAARYHLALGRPVELCVWLPWAGFHAVLIVGRGARGYRVLNWTRGGALSYVRPRDLGAALAHVQRCKGTLSRPACYFRANW